MFPKNKRYVNEAFLERVRLQKCIVCGATPSDPHHVTTVKAGGGDTPVNVMPLCRVCHTSWHKMGPGKMVEKYRAVKEWLEHAGRTDVLERTGRVK